MAQFVTSKEEYDCLRRRAAQVFLMSSDGLPAPVFLGGFGNFKFVEFDVMLFSEFWDVLAACAKDYRDSEVDLLAFDPAPDTYYFKHFGCYSAVRFGLDAVRQDYKDTLLAAPVDSSADALQYNMRTGGWFGTSKRWAFWGERDLGIGIAAKQDADIPWPAIAGIHWFDLEEALSSLIAPNFADGVIPDTFLRKLAWLSSTTGITKSS